MGAIWGLHLPYITCYLLINLSFRIENKWRGQNFFHFSDRQLKNRDLNPYLEGAGFVLLKDLFTLLSQPESLLRW